MHTKTFLRLSSLLIPAEQISQLNLDARKATTGEPFIEIFLHGMQDPFNIDGQAAAVAFETLRDVTPTLVPPVAPYVNIKTPSGLIPSPVPVNVVIGDESFDASAIEWVDFQTQFEDGLGVEMRLSFDPIGSTRQFIGEMASVAYDALSVLAVNEIV